ncbi:hypothetical protein LR48_Vigan10g257900 [Vigna angularis]|uniref:Cupin type-1 domain-containing protein n=1 Tax=Phaseolus angularis TaxID=3914 RepID=A0A0L9VP58_PHAAN|nr:hypothetical protein LR48_Vigan10g257900 [Vigna angularis]
MCESSFQSFGFVALIFAVATMKAAALSDEDFPCSPTKETVKLDIVPKRHGPRSNPQFDLE